MKIYQGKRTIDGLIVTVDGRPLGEHYEVKRFTKFGFEWTYEGDSPQQLALAILADYLGDNARAVRLAEPFMKQVVANLDNDGRLGHDLATADRLPQRIPFPHRRLVQRLFPRRADLHHGRGGVHHLRLA